MANKFDEYPEHIQDSIEAIFESNATDEQPQQLCELVKYSCKVIKWFMDNSTIDKPTPN